MSTPATGFSWRQIRWRLARRTSQALLLLGFLLGPWFGIWILDGNLSSSVLLGRIPLTDPFVLAQSLAAGHWPTAAAWTGAAIVVAVYLAVGGRSFCAWVCPVNLITDAAGAWRRRLGLRGGWSPNRNLRFWLMLACLAAAAVTGRLAWEYLNPISATVRGLLFGFGLTAAPLVAIFLFDVFVAQRGWCGHLCPMGAFYRLLGKTALVRMAAPRRDACTDCMDCFAVCPEPQVIRPALKGKGTTRILDADCTLCGRCDEVCSEQVFRIALRFERQPGNDDRH